MKNFYHFLFLVLFNLIGIFSSAQSKSAEKASSEKVTKKPVVKYGVASYYASTFHKQKTFSGETYDQERLTAACNIFPVNTWIKVTNLSNNKTVIVKINDRLHAKNKRIVDLSKSAAQVLGYISAGITKVRVEVIKDFEKFL